MNISFNLGALRETSWREYAIRFAFGGGVTALTGELAHLYGPGIGAFVWIAGCLRAWWWVHDRRR